MPTTKRFTPPEVDLTLYFTIDDNGKYVKLVDMTSEELAGELAKAYDLIGDIRLALDSDSFRKIQKVRAKVRAFMNPGPKTP